MVAHLDVFKEHELVAAAASPEEAASILHSWLEQFQRSQSGQEAGGKGDGTVMSE